MKFYKYSRFSLLTRSLIQAKYFLWN